MDGLGRRKMTFNFDEMLSFSLGEQQVSDHETIKAMLPGCISVQDSSHLLNLAGVDYVARLRGGAEVLIDAKTRTKGCSRYWYNNEPELALELWSVKPGGKFKTPTSQQKTGWTLSEEKKVQLILFKFHPDDTEQVYLVCFQLLRVAFRANVRQWMHGAYRIDTQESHRNGTGWESECVFVPANVVYDAIRKASLGRLRTANQAPLI